MGEDLKIIKIVLIGDSSVGKTSILIRWAHGKFENTVQTIGVDFRNKVVERNGIKYKAQIWDTAGQEKFKSITKSYFQKAQGIILAYDVTSISSFEHIPTWIESIKESCSTQVPIIIIGNKIDLEEKVNRDDALYFANANNCPFFATSAANGEGIEEAINHLIDMIIENANSHGFEIVNDVQVLDDGSKRKKCC
ncbi:Ras-related protein Rab-13 [Histomonas meleagridis]|uniref:Ras-related protein Rab-13 n=1 Tax=Histomonas meleagridis TaxID=135588 RepID=UPI0035595706|nr:Ras-related protein Rab-13 [Histomonas meleagridis]KAH0800625.1 Ras-related protein Rab-13 [Histomonas meleagridis]